MFPLISFIVFLLLWRHVVVLSNLDKLHRHWLWRNIHPVRLDNTRDDVCFLAGVALTCFVGSLLWELVAWLNTG